MALVYLSSETERMLERVLAQGSILYRRSVGFVVRILIVFQNQC